MCEYVSDANLADFYKETKRRAKKQHKCACCGGAIRQGKVYSVVAYSFEGEFGSDKCCASCARVRDTFGKAHHFYPNPDSIVPYLEECIEERDEAYQRWARMLRTIKQRRLAAATWSASNG